MPDLDELEKSIHKHIEEKQSIKNKNQLIYLKHLKHLKHQMNQINLKII